MKNILLILSLFIFSDIRAQLPSYRQGDWKDVGSMDTSFPSNSVRLEDFLSGNANYDSSLREAISYLEQIGGGTIHLGEGTFTFKSTIRLKSNIRLKGTGKKSILEFDFNHASDNCIELSGKSIGNKIYIDSVRNRMIYIRETLLDATHKLVKLGFNDSALMTSSWAHGSAGQFLRIQSIEGHAIEVKDSIQLGLALGRNPYVQIVQPIENASIQCLSLIRKDSSAGQSSNIYIDYGLNCSVSGVESYRTNFAHICLNRSTQCRIERNYIHHSFGYGGGGQGYGVVMQMGSDKNIARDNILDYLRHSVLLQSGANNNVVAYNSSSTPFVTDNVLSDAGGDLVCHGNYPYFNLFEGNICQTIIIDNSHGKNGPYNTFFRNRAELYGILISSGQDSQNFICNEITNTSSLKGLFVTNGIGHFRNSNTIKGNLSDGSINYPKSMYLSGLPDFWSIPFADWGIGHPNEYRRGKNPARVRWTDSLDLSPCHSSKQTTRIQPVDLTPLTIYPNPVKAGESLHLSRTFERVEIYTSQGICVNRFETVSEFKITDLPDGVYILCLDGALYVQIAVLN